MCYIIIVLQHAVVLLSSPLGTGRTRHIMAAAARVNASRRIPRQNRRISTHEKVSGVRALWSATRQSRETTIASRTTTAAITFFGVPCPPPNHHYHCRQRPQRCTTDGRVATQTRQRVSATT